MHLILKVTPCAATSTSSNCLPSFPSPSQWAAFEDQYGIYLVSEYASKGDVFADVEKRGGQMTEAETVRQVIHPFLLSLMYLHDLNIMHRDIKPENLLFTATGVLKVAGQNSAMRS